jgi:adenosylcobinamide kinase/adenosylcobinamide-phosphate guanylyltransferase
VARALQSAPATQVVLLDCVTLWVSNVLLAHETHALDEMNRQLQELLAWHRATDCALILVSNEVGMSVVPSYPLGRAFRDLLGSVNRTLAAEATQVYWLVAGLPVDIKSLAAPRTPE